MDIPHIPDYELLAEIGRNSLTRLFAARHRAGGFHCVVKTIRDDIDQQQLAIQSIKNEARIGLAARHRHVIRVYDAQVHVSPCYVILECVNGESLQSRLQSGPLDWAQSLVIARQIGEALVAVHQLGHVHGNLNTSSVLIRPDGTAILSEFGSAHRPGDLPAGHTFASDWHAFGMTMVELLTGESPVLTDQPNDILRYQSRTALEGWAKRRSMTLPTSLTDLFGKTTDANPRSRPSGHQILSELKWLESNDPSQSQAA